MRYEIINKDHWRLDLLMTSPKLSARFAGVAGNMAKGDIVHILHANVHNHKVLITVISLDLLNRKTWGPYCCSPQLGYDLQDSDISKIIHTEGYLKIMGKSKDEKLPSLSLTNFVKGLPYMDWRIVWTLLDKIRNERIRDRLKNPRETATQKFPDDILDVALNRISNDQYLPFAGK